MDKNYIYEVTMYDKDGGKVVQKIAEDSETYADLIIDLQARNNKYIRGEITRTSDGFVMYDTSHDSFLRAYEELDTEEYIADKPLHIQLARSEKPSVYIDVDGTAAYWYKDGRGLSYPEQILDPKNHYYRDLEPHPFIVDLAERLDRDGYDVCVLSATARECIADRFEWIDRHMPFIPKENVFLCPVGADKKQYCKDNSDISVLIDDYDKNLREWNGQAVKSVNSINSPTPDFPCLMTFGLEQYRSENKSLYIEELNSSVSFIENILDYYEKSVEYSKKDYEQLEQNAKKAQIAFSEHRGILQSAKIAGFAKTERLIAVDPSGDFILRHREKKNNDIERE